MDLILWRHAEAEDGSPDFARKLTAKGEKQARRIAEWLHAHLPDSARVLASPAVRTQQTAQALAALTQRKFKTVDALAPGASAEAVLTVAGWPDGKRAVVVVGHQPTLGWVASQLLASQVQNWSIKKSGAWWFQSRDREGDAAVVLRAVVNPEML